MNGKSTESQALGGIAIFRGMEHQLHHQHDIATELRYQLAENSLSILFHERKLTRSLFQAHVA